MHSTSGTNKSVPYGAIEKLHRMRCIRKDTTQRNKSLLGFVKNLPAASEMPAGVRGFISFHIEQSEIFHNVS